MHKPECHRSAPSVCFAVRVAFLNQLHWTLATVALLTGSASAYSQQNDVDALRARYAAEQDISVLRERQKVIERSAGPLQDRLIERGVLFLRLHELTSLPRDVQDALEAFQRAADVITTDPRPRYGIGLAYVAIANASSNSRAALASRKLEATGRDPIAVANQSFQKVLDLDPDHRGAAMELGRLSLPVNERYMARAAQTLRRALIANSATLSNLLLLSDLEGALGNASAALEAAERAAAQAADPEQRAMTAHARAAALLLHNAETGAAAYFEGVAELTGAATRLYRDAVSVIATPSEQAAWTGADVLGKREWLERFWSVRAARSGTTVAERLAEHYRRMAVARKDYRRIGERGAPPGGSLILRPQNEQTEYDDRGVLYIRHGPPAKVVRTSDVDLRPNETWVYDTGDAYSLYNFVMLRDGTDFRLVDDLLAALDPSTRGIPVHAATKLLRDRQAYEPRYAAMAERFDSYDRAFRIKIPDAAAGAGERMDDNMRSVNTTRTFVAADLRAGAYVALTTDTDPPAFTNELPFYYDLYSFQGAAGTTDITVAAAIPGPSLTTRQNGAQLIYSVQASLIFLDTIANLVFRKDTLMMFAAARSLRENEHLRFAFDMPLTGSRSHIHRIVIRDANNPGAGKLYGGPSELKSFTASGLMISDLVLAEVKAGAWRRGSVGLSIVPPREFVQNQAFTIFYEIYNLAPGTPYRTQINVVPLDGANVFGRLAKVFGGSDGRMLLEFDGVSPQGQATTLQELKQIATEFRPGKYKLIVGVTTLDNRQSVRTETIFFIRPI